MKFVKMTLLLMIFLSALLFPQEGESQTTSRLMMVKSLAQSSDPELKATALDDLDSLLAENPAELEKNGALEILYFMVSEGVTSITYEGFKKGVTSASIKAGAAELLGQYGGEDAVTPLANVMYYDDDPLSIGAAVTASSILKAEKKEKIVDAYARILKNTRMVYNNEALIQSVLMGIGELAETYPEVFDNEDLMEGLDLSSQGYSGYARKTRKMARELIQNAELNRE